MPRTTINVRTEQLPVKLTENEIKDAGRKLAQLEGALGEHAAKEKEIKDDLKSKRSSFEGQIAQLASVIRQGHEYRPVSVRIEADYAEDRMYEIREDTLDTVGVRPLTEQDRQARLFPAEDAQKTAEAVADAILENAGAGEPVKRTRKKKE